jgi:HPt (histidine-containing phosphotransfer) domain-containing protein
MPEMTRESILNSMLEAAERMGLDLEDLQEMINEVLEDCQEKAVRLKEAIVSGDSGTVKKIAHDVKGSTANYGLNSISALAFDLEKNNESPSIDSVEEMIKQLETLSAFGLDS